MFRLFGGWKEKRNKALFGLLVAGSVLMVGYLPSAIGPSPEAVPASTLAPPHEPFGARQLAAAGAVYELLGDCKSCHVMTDNTISTKPFPGIPHRTEGWEECSFCHAQRRLAPVPENHVDIPDSLCQACHQPSTTPPPSLGHVPWQGKTCSSCHGTSLALPTTHEDRGESTCVLCHEAAKVPPPSIPHAVRTGGLCTECHTSSDPPPLLPQHAGWGDDLCTTCHTVEPGGVPTVPHALDSRTECSFCHLAGPSGRTRGLARD